MRLRSLSLFFLIKSSSYHEKQISDKPNEAAKVSAHMYKYETVVNCLIKHHPMETYWGVEVELHAFLTPALVGGAWSASRPGRFTLG
jgi:hypothetical protein